MYTVETYTFENGSNMDAIAYKDIPFESIREDLLASFSDWDYAAVFDGDDNVRCFINRECEGAEIVMA